MIARFVDYFPIFHLPQFLIGSITGIIYLRKIKDSRSITVRDHAIGAGAFAIIVVMIFFTRIDYPFVNNGLFAPLFAVIFYQLARDPGPITRILSAKILIVLGEASYAVYILQYPLASLFFRVVHHAWGMDVLPGWQFPAFLLILVSASVASYYGLEKPTRRWIVGSANRWLDKRNEGELLSPGVSPSQIAGKD